MKRTRPSQKDTVKKDEQKRSTVESPINGNIPKKIYINLCYFSENLLILNIL